MSTAFEILVQAKALHRAGQLSDAVQLYQQALAADPTLAEVHYCLGIAWHGLGNAPQAVASLEQAIGLQPNYADALNLLGAILAQQGKLSEAIESFERALQHQPKSFDISNNLRQARAVDENNRGAALAERRKLDEAAACYRRALDLRPNFPEAYNNLGAVLVWQGKPDEAVVCLRRSLELNPGNAGAYHNLANALEKLDQWDEAEACCRRAIELQPGYLEAFHTLGTLLRDQHKLDEAADCWRRVIELAPESAAAHFNLGTVFDKQDRLAEAAISFRRALELKPDAPEVYLNLGVVLSDQGQFDDAEACWRRAIELKPDAADVYHRRGNMLMRHGKPAEAIASYYKALEIEPRLEVAHSDALFASQYLADVTLQKLAAAHADFEKRYGLALRATWRPHENRPDPERRLRLGFVSADFGFHPVSYFLVRVLENLDQRQVETWCYSDRVGTDAMKIRLRAAATSWRECALNDERLAEQIRNDRIDILFDLAGHTGSNRLLMFARKPAPIQITWIGYEGSTGLAAIDYLLADRYEIPESAESTISERVLRMPDGCFCYDPPADAPPISPLPTIGQGYVTFGSFNNPAKLTLEVIDVWSAVLHRVAGSRLVLKYRWLDSPAVKGRIEQKFAKRGVGADRLQLLGWSPHADMLRQYQQIDLALDPFPFNGGITTCDALWMGIPVVTCPGETFASRHSLTHLSNVGLTETIAADLMEYVDIAADLAADLPRLSAMRAGLREQMAGSPLCDGRRFAQNFVGVLRGAWRQWCSEQKQ